MPIISGEYDYRVILWERRFKTLNPSERLEEFQKALLVLHSHCEKNNIAFQISQGIQNMALQDRGILIEFLVQVNLKPEIVSGYLYRWHENGIWIRLGDNDLRHYPYEKMKGFRFVL